jgi:hypothetical protein
MKFRCTQCGAEHTLDELAWHFAEPLPWLLATEAERDDSELTSDQCALATEGQVHYFIHAGEGRSPIRGTRFFVFGS